ncbi:transposase [Streptomyces sp. NBC_00645]|uniref:transposase n=1 Tax=Streptomyces sp. NBC_00645 TaxID=2975795 RepID=UPI003244D5D7
MAVDLERELVPDGLWEIAAPLIPPFKPRRQGGGTAPVADRKVFCAIVYALTTSRAWRRLPSCFGVSPGTAHRRFAAREHRNCFTGATRRASLAQSGVGAHAGTDPGSARGLGRPPRDICERTGAMNGAARAVVPARRSRCPLHGRSRACQDEHTESCDRSARYCPRSTHGDTGLRFVRQAAQDGKPVLIVNQDPTRGDQRAVTRVALPWARPSPPWPTGWTSPWTKPRPERA